MRVQTKAACGLQFKVDGPEGVVEGYAATWDRDLGGDRYEKGAFRDPIANDFPSGRVKIYREHDVAIGLPTELREDDTGLWVSAKIIPGDSRAGDETVNLAKSGVYDSFSVAYKVDPSSVRFVAEGSQRTRVIGRVPSLPHIGILGDPMNPAAVIQAVKGQLALAGAGAEYKGLFALSEALHHLAMVEEIQLWAELSPEEAELARQVLEELEATGAAIKSRLPLGASEVQGDDMDVAALLEAVRGMKKTAEHGAKTWQT